MARLKSAASSYSLPLSRLPQLRVRVHPVSANMKSCAEPSALLRPRKYECLLLAAASWWGQRIGCSVLKLISVPRCSSGCSRFTWVQRVMHYPRKCNIHQEMTARSVKGHRGWTDVAEGSWLAPVHLGKLQPSFPVFWLLNILSALHCSRLKAKNTSLTVPQPGRLSDFTLWEVEHDSREQRFEEEICFSCTVGAKKLQGWLFKMKELYF